jgi:hypothetical protein
MKQFYEGTGMLGSPMLGFWEARRQRKTLIKKEKQRREE